MKIANFNDKFQRKIFLEMNIICSRIGSTFDQFAPLCMVQLPKSEVLTIGAVVLRRNALCLMSYGTKYMCLHRSHVVLSVLKSCAFTVLYTFLFIKFFLLKVSHFSRIQYFSVKKANGTLDHCYHSYLKFHFIYIQFFFFCTVVYM